MKTSSLVAIVSAGILFLGGSTIGIRFALAEGGWKAEFESVCSNTDRAMVLTQDELKDFIARCDRLTPLIEAEDESARRVYQKRLKMCKDLFVYMLESKNSR
jgi:hypothetical protein